MEKEGMAMGMVSKEVVLPRVMPKLAMGLEG